MVTIHIHDMQVYGDHSYNIHISVTFLLLRIYIYIHIPNLLILTASLLPDFRTANGVVLVKLFLHIQLFFICPYLEILLSY